MAHRLSTGLAALLSFALAGLASAAFAETGVTADEIKIGMVNAQSGPAAALGQGIKRGSEAYFKRVNGAGGVHGRKISLVVEDDGYEPSRTASATDKLVNKDKVFALFGFVGTPTSKSAMPFVTAGKVPFFAPFTGAEFLRTPVNPYVFNVRASYFTETEMQVDRLVGDSGSKSIALFAQDDTYGNVGKDAAMRALQKHKLSLSAEGRYKRNTEDVDAALATLIAAKPDAVLMVGTYKACAALVRKASAQGFKPKFFNLSFVGTSDFIKEAGREGENVYITQVVPSPSDDALPIVKQYQADMRAAGHNEFDYTSLEGYIDAVALVEGLNATGADLTRDTFLHALDRLKVSLGGLELSFDPQSHQGLKQIYLTKVLKGKASPVSKL